MINDRIELMVEHNIAHVRFSRPEKMNALDQKMFKAIPQVAVKLRDDPSIRAVVLSAEGDNFCSGLDKSYFANLLEKPDTGQSAAELPQILADRTHGIANLAQYAAWMWRELPMPVIVAIQGVAFGGGLQVALGGDFRYASPSSRFSILELKWGIVPDMSSTQIMRHMIRDDVIRELTYTAKVFSADEAKEWGFITAIVEDPLAHAMQAAKEIALKNPQAIRSAKKIIGASYYQSAAEGLLMESMEQDKVIGQANQIEAVLATLQDREPCFKD